MPDLNRRTLRGFIERLSLSNNTSNTSSTSGNLPRTSSAPSGIHVQNTISVVSTAHSESAESNMAAPGRDRRVSFAEGLVVPETVQENASNNTVVASEQTVDENASSGGDSQPSSSQQTTVVEETGVSAPAAVENTAANDQNTMPVSGDVAANAAHPADPVTPVQRPMPGFQPGQEPPMFEVFPPLQLSPFHQNAVFGRNIARDYELPGEERYPRYQGARPLNGIWMNARFDHFTVGGRTFFVPIHLLLRYQFWRLLAGLERPATGWNLPNTDPAIFSLVMECLISASGFEGTELGINLVKLLVATKQAADWGMDREVNKFVASIRRYVARRLFYRNPHRPDMEGVMDHNYFVYRSEEIYRAWKVVQNSRVLQKYFAGAEFVSLYGLVIPTDIWPALTAEFPDSFNQMIDFTARLRVVPTEMTFHDWWLRFFRLAGYLDYQWMPDLPNVLNLFFGQDDADLGSDAATGSESDTLVDHGGPGASINSRANRAVQIHLPPPGDASLTGLGIIDVPLFDEISIPSSESEQAPGDGTTAST